MRDIAVRPLPRERWAEYRELRLTALKSDPSAFGSSYEEEIERTQDEWERRMKNALFAMQADVSVGMVVCGFETRSKTRHVAHIFGMFVKKEHRGRGIGSLLMAEALRQIKRNPDVVKVTLSVNSSQRDAVALYERCGFLTIGTQRRELKVNGVFYDMSVMELLF